MKKQTIKEVTRERYSRFRAFTESRYNFFNQPIIRIEGFSDEEGVVKTPLTTITKFYEENGINTTDINENKMSDDELKTLMDEFVEFVVTEICHNVELVDHDFYRVIDGETRFYKNPTILVRLHDSYKNENDYQFCAYGIFQ